MWVYRYVNSKYDVGYYVSDLGEASWQHIKSFVKEWDAAKYVSYLNGGEGNAKACLARSVEVPDA